MERKPVFWLTEAFKTPPFTAEGRKEAGVLLGLLQAGERLGMPYSRPLPTVGPRCHELRVRDASHQWRIVYRIDPKFIIVAHVFAKKDKKMQQREFSKATDVLAKFDRL